MQPNQWNGHNSRKPDSRTQSHQILARSASSPNEWELCTPSLTSTAVVAVFDNDREQAVAYPKMGSSWPLKKKVDESFILLRIQKEARLPAASENDQTRQGIIEDSGNEGPWLPECRHGSKTKCPCRFGVLSIGYVHAATRRLLPIRRGHRQLLRSQRVDGMEAGPSFAEPHRQPQHRSNDIPISSANTKIGMTASPLLSAATLSKPNFRSTQLTS